MCGIIGYVGYKDAPGVLIKGLKKLEYRGYDSAGVAVFHNDKISIFKNKGKVSVLESKLSEVDLTGSTCGIGHTRWATHGEPSDINSHPHIGNRVVLVHNGIIENYLELKKYLVETRGCNVTSQTDTEIIAHLIDSFYNGDPINAIFEATTRLKGSFALGVLFTDRPGTIYAIRRDSPLIIGVGKGENFIASDIPAILPYTKDYYISEQDEIAVITKDNIEFITRDRVPSTKELLKAAWDEQSAKKGGYEHYMLKEIYEQPKVIRDTIGRYKNGQELFPEDKNELNIKGSLHIVACGSAMHAALLGKYAIERMARIPVNVYIASEFRYQNPILKKDDIVLAISQSGETADTLAALRLAKEMGIKTIGLVNVWGSTLAREADHVLYTCAGPEISVATTKAYLCQVCVLYMLALFLGKSKMPIKEYEQYVDELDRLDEAISKMLDQSENYKYLASKFMNAHDLFFIGRGQDYYLSLEGSLKLKEISYVHSEAYAAGELKHGTISLITKGVPVVAIMTDRTRILKTAANIKEVVSRGADVLCITYADVDVDDFAHYKINVIDLCEFYAPILTTVALQLFAYYVAVLKGNDVDKPRNLAKSVTVE